MEGFKTHRHKNNPKEKELHDKFIKEHIENNDSPFDLIIFPSVVNYEWTPSDHLSDREKQIVITTIQWLGSPLGQSFLKDCGFSLNK